MIIIYHSCLDLQCYNRFLSGHPLKLYFDLEFSILQNTNKDGKLMIDSLINTLNNVVKEQFDINNSISDVLILDSSTDIKFSSHLIFNKIIFENYLACKNFVIELVKHLDQTKLDFFKVKDIKNNIKSFIDLSVYNKYQNFRLLFSSKFGKQSFLEVSDSDVSHYWYECDRDIFFSSLICYDGLVANTLVVNLKTPNSESFNEVDVCIDIPRNNKILQSDYPDIDKLVSSLIDCGHIRKISYFENLNTKKPMLIYEIENYNYCSHVERMHRRNHIYFIGDPFRKWKVII